MSMARILTSLRSSISAIESPPPRYSRGAFDYGREVGWPPRAGWSGWPPPGPAPSIQGEQIHAAPTSWTPWLVGLPPLQIRHRSEVDSKYLTLGLESSVSHSRKGKEKARADEPGGWSSPVNGQRIDEHLAYGWGSSPQSSTDPPWPAWMGAARSSARA